jgi:hypothetical protein
MDAVVSHKSVVIINQILEQIRMMISDRLTDVLSLWLTGAQQMSKCDELNPAITKKVSAGVGGISQRNV